LLVTCGRSVIYLINPASSTNKTDRHDIAEMLMKVALNTSCCLDIDSVTGDRVYSLPANSIPQDTDPTCDFCSYTTAPPDNDTRILQRIGTFA
jgi:hypothetical protein